MLRVVGRLASVTPWTIERETSAIRRGDRVRVTSPDWGSSDSGAVTEIWAREADGERMACVRLDDLEEDVSFPIDDLVLQF